MFTNKDLLFTLHKPETLKILSKRRPYVNSSAILLVQATAEAEYFLVHMKNLNISATTLINSAGEEVPLLRYRTSLKQCFKISTFLSCCLTATLKEAEVQAYNDIYNHEPRILETRQILELRKVYSFAFFEK
jgi:hypothetical protein